MVKQCPRCWEKVSPDDAVCPNCGYDLVRKAAPIAKKVRTQVDEPDKRSIFPTREKKDKRESSFPLKLATVLVLVWAVIAVLGGIVNLANDELLQGAGFVASGVLSFIAFYLIYQRQRNYLTCMVIIISGVLTFQIILLIISFFVSFLVYASGKFFKN